VQPAFDALWGGTDRMYAQRLGVERALASNPIGAMHATGVSLAFGSDSPVTALDPWAAVAAAAAPRNPAYRMSVRAAFAASTRGGWRAAGSAGWGCWRRARRRRSRCGTRRAGAGGLPACCRTPTACPGLPVCRRTVLAGETIYES
jgi:hypothetical protein